MLRRLLLTPSVALFLILAVSVGAKGQGITNDSVAGIVKRFSAELDCGANSRDLWRSWCGVMQAGKWNFIAPTFKKFYLGFSMQLKPGERVKKALMNTLEASALLIGPKEAKLTALKPSNDQEKKDMAPLIFKLSAILKGMDKKGTISISSGLFGFLKGMTMKSLYPLQIGKVSGVYKGKLPSRLFLVKGMPYGNAYVAVEDAGAGFFISIFPIVKPVAE